MIKLSGRYDEYAYFVSQIKASPALIAAGFEGGTMLTRGADGLWEKADGTKKAYMSHGSKSRNRSNVMQVSREENAVLFGAYIVQTSEYEKSSGGSPITYAINDPLKVSADGKLEKAASGDTIVGYVWGTETTEGKRPDGTDYTFIEVAMLP